MSVLFYAAQLFLLFSTAQCGYKPPEEMQEVIDSLHASCIAESGVSEDLIAKAQEGNFQEDQSLKCYMKCTVDNMGCITDDGKLDVDALLAIFPPDLAAIVTNDIKKCGSQPGVDVCDVVYQTNLCWYKANPAMYFLA